MAKKALDHRKFLRDADTAPTPAQRAAFQAIVFNTIQTLRGSTREEVNSAINRLLHNPTTKQQVGSQLIEQLPVEIERGLEHT